MAGAGENRPGSFVTTDLRMLQYFPSLLSITPSEAIIYIYLHITSSFLALMEIQRALSEVRLFLWFSPSNILTFAAPFISSVLSICFLEDQFLLIF